ncbi:DUF4189 domain-containing protein [Xanthomonas fragariae]|uniref:DUF4189 domain-containing protein n=1 Tax=Xanthomonas fragariae TaxID=48664 RepID=UPI00131EF154|nr:DUF4189 domain-containing protein [Xanthomonas fragariae]
MKNTVLLVFLVFIGMGTNAQAEQGCPPGQYPIGGQGVAACAPIPQENSTQQEPRASGKGIKTWGAIASDGGDNLGVAKGKFTKSDAQEEALSKCKSVSGKECQIDFVYKNQCTAIAEPHKTKVLCQEYFPTLVAQRLMSRVVMLLQTAINTTKV